VALNALIMSTLITKLFGDDYLLHASRLQAYTTRWNLLNLIRMALAGAAIVYLFQAFRPLDRTDSHDARNVAGRS
jgi:hypothetical protein